jgi:hypothetical protein
MTGGAPFRAQSVLAIERESSHGGVIESRLVEGPQLAVNAGMFRMTRHTVVLHVLVDTHAPGNPLGNRTMARQTLGRSHSPTTLVTLLAVGQPFDPRVRLCEPSRRHKGSKLCVGGPGR